MRVLITGGTGVIGQGVIEELLKRGHRVRLVSRHATDDVREWPQEQVDARNGDVSEAATLLGAADDCDAVLHIAGIAQEHPPDITFEKVNVIGTRNIVDEAKRAGVRRLIHISSLGADRGESDYHVSKLSAEEIVRASDLEWVIVRPGNVYGPGDEVISLLLKMVRALPAVPTIDFGDQSFQPIWFRDLGTALATLVESNDYKGQVLELAGREVTSMNDVITRLGALTGRTPIQVPVPAPIARLASNVAENFGIPLPIDKNKLTMLQEENVVRGENALITTLGVEATSLDEGLRILSESLPEQLPSDGVGRLREKRFWVDIRNSTYNRQELFERFRNEFGEVMPLDVGVEEETKKRLVEGETISMKLPLRGNIQVRVEKVTSSSIVLATLEGHPIAGLVRFNFTNHEGMIRFEVRVLDRSGNFFDFFAMETVGGMLQDRAWQTVVQRVLDDSGGEAVGGIQVDQRELTADAAERAEEWGAEIVNERKRSERERDLERSDSPRSS